MRYQETVLRMNSQPHGLETQSTRSQHVRSQISLCACRLQLQTIATRGQCRPGHFVSGPDGSPTGRAGSGCSVKIPKVKQSTRRANGNRPWEAGVGVDFLVLRLTASPPGFWLSPPSTNALPEPSRASLGSRYSNPFP